MTDKATHHLRFQRIQLENWKNFTGVDVHLQRRVFLVGPNAAGKSNLLDAFRFLRDLVAEGGGFREAVARRGGASRIRCLAARRYPEIALAVDVQSDTGGPLWHYELRFTQDNHRRPMVSREAVFRDGEMLLERPDGDDESDIERLTHASSDARAGKSC